MNLNYELIDCGQFRRLEKFGDLLCNRPAPMAENARSVDEKLWRAADLYFDATTKTWRGTAKNDWRFIVDDLVLQLTCGANGQVGVFPEQLAQWSWLHEIINAQTARGKTINVLNAFAYTGAATLFCARAGAKVCHLDGAKSTITQAQKNAQLSNLNNAPIRWIVDDVMKFLTREIKRKNFYDGIILDPPAFGRAGKNCWQLENDLPQLLECAYSLLTPQPLFFLISCHQTGWRENDLQEMINHHLPIGKTATVQKLTIPGQYNDLDLGLFWRVSL